MTKRDSRGLMILDRSLLAGGVILLGIYAAAQLDRSVSSRLALREFDLALAAAIEGPPDAQQLQDEEGVDFRLWSEKRVRAYRESLPVLKRSPLAVIHIEKV